MSHRWPRWFALVAALLFLDASLTFHNIWPTPAVRWTGELSLELAACLLVLAAAHRVVGRPTPGVLAVLSALWILLIVGRFAEVTAPALFGRDINLYWDLRFVPGVTALLVRAAPVWLVAAAGLFTLLVFALLYRSVRWALGRVADAAANPVEQRALAVLAAAIVVLFLVQPSGAEPPGFPVVAVPVTLTYARQVRLMAAAFVGPTSIAASPSLSSDFARVAGADVFLIFVESYGAVTYERPEFAAGLAASRARFDAAIRETKRDVVSAYVESPTFGGSSWLAHISLLAGVEVRDPATNALLMTQKRDTLVTAFARHRYRTVALMPGLWQRWPEGAFYGFDEIYGGARLAYQGPPFGWFDVPDQVSLAKLDAIEASRPSRAPLFVFFPTISTHTPFRPTPPYQSDWPRVLTDRPFDEADVTSAFLKYSDWLNLGPSYVDAVSYDFATFGGYLRARGDRDFVMILVGDHQPPALVSGEGAPWDVPVHVIASRPRILERLLARGFRPGLTPARPAIGRMHELQQVLLDAFGDRAPGSVDAAASVAPGLPSLP